MKYSAHIMGPLFFFFFLIFSFEGVVAYEIRYSIIIAFGHSQYYTLITEESVEQRHLYIRMCVYVEIAVMLYVMEWEVCVWMSVSYKKKSLCTNQWLHHDKPVFHG